MPAAESPAEVIQSLARGAEGRDRPDLAHRLRTGLQRATRPDTVVCVVGEFKQGKSSLVNALLEAQVCPVDDDLATAVPTVIRHGPRTSVTVFQRIDGAARATPIEPDELPAWTTEAGNPDNERSVEQVEIVLDHPVLERGLVLVDTPGAGGLQAGHAMATAAFLHYADALLFVTDASAELSAPELDFVRDAVAACPDVVVALTKTDLYPAWKHIAEIDVGHLASADVTAPIMPCSAAALAAAHRIGDTDLVGESGIPAMRDLLEEQVLDPSRDRAIGVLLDDCLAVLDHLDTAAAAELGLLRDPEQVAAATARYQELVDRLDELRASGARWQQVLNDGVTDVSSEITFRFRADVRHLTEEIDAEVEALRTPEEWDTLAAGLQQRVADMMTGIFGELDRRTDEIAQQVRDLLRDELVFATEADAHTALPQLIERNLALPEQPGGLKRVGSGTVGALRGAQSGLLLFGLLGRYLPMGAAAIMFSNPVTLVLGAAFAGKQVHNLRRQSLTARRQQARVAVRAFLDEFQMEASNRLAELLRERSRNLRDHFTDRVTDLQVTAHSLAEHARQEASSLESDRARREPLLVAETNDLATIRATVDALVTTLEHRRAARVAPSPDSAEPSA